MAPPLPVPIDPPPYGFRFRRMLAGEDRPAIAGSSRSPRTPPKVRSSTFKYHPYLTPPSNRSSSSVSTYQALRASTPYRSYPLPTTPIRLTPESQFSTAYDPCRCRWMNPNRGPHNDSTHFDPCLYLYKSNSSDGTVSLSEIKTHLQSHVSPYFAILARDDPAFKTFMDSDTITAQLTYIMPPPNGGRVYQLFSSRTGELEEANIVLALHDMFIENVRGKEDSYTLDDAGFQFLHRPTKLSR
ncbi:hypothetical protein L218DRAFT_1008243 [Marasmius fiardii PR-910]|nr:hypothetical protein L218DRAFT_1008243 [Marasmius fiardii PR-910]